MLLIKIYYLSCTFFNNSINKLRYLPGLASAIVCFEIQQSEVDSAQSQKLYVLRKNSRNNFLVKILMQQNDFDKCQSHHLLDRSRFHTILIMWKGT